MHLRYFVCGSIILAIVWFAGCGTASTSPPQSRLSSRATQTAAPTDSLPHPTQTPSGDNGPLQVFTFADDEKTVTLRVGVQFALDLGPSAGSPWAIDVTDPAALEPTLRQISGTGSRVLFNPIKAGRFRIEAESHIPCSGHGFCPEAITHFTLNLQIQPENSESR